LTVSRFVDSPLLRDLLAILVTIIEPPPPYLSVPPTSYPLPYSPGDPPPPYVFFHFPPVSMCYITLPCARFASPSPYFPPETPVLALVQCFLHTQQPTTPNYKIMAFLFFSPPSPYWFRFAPNSSPKQSHYPLCPLGPVFLVPDLPPLHRPYSSGRFMYQADGQELPVFFLMLSVQQCPPPSPTPEP